MVRVALRQGFARLVWLGVVCGMPSAVAAAPPVLVGMSMFLDRTGLPQGVVGNGQGLVAMAWAATPTLLQARIYDALGPPRTPVFEVTNGAMQLFKVYLTAEASGGILVSWVRDYASGVGTLVARRYAWNGSPATPEIVVGTGIPVTSLYRSFDFSLAADGSFLVAFQKPAGTSLEVSLAVRAFESSGQPLGLETVVSTGPAQSFAKVALGRSAEGVVVAYGKSIGSGSFTEVWAQRLDALGTPRSPEIAIVPADQNFGRLPSGVAVFPGGRFAVGYQTCDPLTLGFSCVAAGIQYVEADDTLLPEPGKGPLFFHSGNESWLVQDPLGNPFVVAAHDGLGDFRAANPLGAVVSKATVSSGLPAVPYPPSTSAAGLVPLAPGQVGLVWYQGDWAYLQTLTMGSETTAAPAFHTLEPCRLVDTRQGGKALGASEDRTVQAAGRCAIPAGARALAANAVSVESTDAGNLRFYRADRQVPGTSTLNYGPGQVRASQTLIPLSDDGALGVRATQATGTTHLIIDVSGYFQ